MSKTHRDRKRHFAETAAKELMRLKLSGYRRALYMEPPDPRFYWLPGWMITYKLYLRRSDKLNRRHQNHSNRQKIKAEIRRQLTDYARSRG